jgi:hypothetical protein
MRTPPINTVARETDRALSRLTVPAWTSSLRVSGLVACALLSLMSGCTAADQGPETHPAGGTLTYQGSPVAGATLTFLADGDGVSAHAVTGEDGRFEAITMFDMGKHEKQGMVAGTYRVTAVKLEKPDVSSTLQPVKDLLPRKYGSANTSGLTASVSPEGKNDFAFSLD